MSKFTEYISRQFSNPRGFIGRCCCVIMNIINRSMYRRILSLLELNDKANMLDIGCGNGHLIKLAYEKFHADMYGVDISEDMRCEAERRNIDAKKSGKLHLDVGDCCNLPYENEFFDAITSVNTIYFWNDTLQGLKEINRTLKAGGCFYNVVYTKEWLQKLPYTKTGFQFFKPSDLVSMGKKAGFSEISVQDIVKGKSFEMIYKK